MDCSICLETLSVTTGFTALACGHHFHLKCVVEWLSTAKSCPCCRAETNDNENIQSQGPLKDMIEELEEAEHERERLGMALSILRKEKNRLEKIVIDGMTDKEELLFRFSRELEKISPSLFKRIVYADAGDGLEVRFHAFLPERMRIAELSAASGIWVPLYEAFTSGMLATYRRAALTAACVACERKAK